MTSRTASSSAATNLAIAGVPDADAMMINARRTRTESCLPLRRSEGWGPQRTMLAMMIRRYRLT
jgi:hypothetical protein